MAIYTYTADHGDKHPTVNASTEINGGKIQGVMFGDALLKLEIAEELLEDILLRTECKVTKGLVEEFYKSVGSPL